MVETFQHEIDRAFARIGITGQAAAILMIVFGVLIIVFPALVAILIGVYLIVVGLLQVLGHFDAMRATRPHTPASTTGSGLPPPPPPPNYP
jgi:uncharacterized membrane protein HdeD (DUF308 family)